HTLPLSALPHHLFYALRELQPYQPPACFATIAPHSHKGLPIHITPQAPVVLYLVFSLYLLGARRAPETLRQIPRTRSLFLYTPSSRRDSSTPWPPSAPTQSWPRIVSYLQQHPQPSALHPCARPRNSSRQSPQSSCPGRRPNSRSRPQQPPPR